MPTVYLRDVPEALVERLRRRARKNRRSMNAEAVAILQRAMDQERDGLRLARRLRELQDTAPEGAPSAVEIIHRGREERERRYRR